MKAFVFKSTNAFIGKFDVSNIDHIAESLSKFGESHTLTASDYIECAGKTWTLVDGGDGLQLVEGRPNPVRADAVSESVADGDAISRYNDAYLTERIITRIGGVVKIIGIAFGILIILIGIIASTELGFGAFISGFVVGSINGIITYVIGVLICALGQILRANLDTAVHTSPFLDDEQRLSIMRIKR